MLKKIQQTIFQQNLFPRNSKIILAISGGPDSVCLLHIFLQLQKKYDLELMLAHVNYGLRGKDSMLDEKLVCGLAKKNNLELALLKAKIGKKASEESLRNIRYDFFEKIRKEKKFDFVATAHNADDNVETFLMRIIRGSGLQGLSAIKHKNNFIIRPLLEISRQEILEYLKKNKLKFRLDKTNDKNLYFRNKIRNLLLPYLEKNFNPNIRKTIAHSIENISEDFDFLQKISMEEWKKNPELSAKKILQLHPAMQKRFLLQMLLEGKSSSAKINSAHVNELLKILRSSKNKRQTFILQNLKIERKNDKLVVSNI